MCICHTAIKDDRSLRSVTKLMDNTASLVVFWAKELKSHKRVESYRVEPGIYWVFRPKGVSNGFPLIRK